MAEPEARPDDAVDPDLPGSVLAVAERNRAALYRWFARLFFCPPGEPEVGELRDGRMRAVLESLAATPGAGAAVAAIRRVLDQGSAASVARALGAAHTCLFDGAGGHRVTPPYRSFFSNDAGLLCQEATGEMEQVLRHYQLKLDADVHEPADHLSLQLEAMAQLALRTAAAIASELDAPTPAATELHAGQATFLDGQLLSWVPRFAERLAAVDETGCGFHASLAALLVIFLEQDRGYLAEIVEPPTGNSTTPFAEGARSADRLGAPGIQFRSS